MYIVIVSITAVTSLKRTRAHVTRFDFILSDYRRATRIAWWRRSRARGSYSLVQRCGSSDDWCVSRTPISQRQAVSINVSWRDLSIFTLQFIVLIIVLTWCNIASFLRGFKKKKKERKKKEEGVNQILCLGRVINFRRANPTRCSPVFFNFSTFKNPHVMFQTPRAYTCYNNRHDRAETINSAIHRYRFT